MVSAVSIFFLSFVSSFRFLQPHPAILRLRIRVLLAVFVTDLAFFHSSITSLYRLFVCLFVLPVRSCVHPFFEQHNKRESAPMCVFLSGRKVDLRTSRARAERKSLSVELIDRSQDRSLARSEVIGFDTSKSPKKKERTAEEGEDAQLKIPDNSWIGLCANRAII